MTHQVNKDFLVMSSQNSVKTRWLTNDKCSRPNTFRRLCQQLKKRTDKMFVTQRFWKLPKTITTLGHKVSFALHSGKLCPEQSVEMSLDRWPRFTSPPRHFHEFFTEHKTKWFTRRQTTYYCVLFEMPDNAQWTFL